MAEPLDHNFELGKTLTVSIEKRDLVTLMANLAGLIKQPTGRPADLQGPTHFVGLSQKEKDNFQRIYNHLAKYLFE